MLVGLHDFAAFRRHRPNATTIRDLQAFEWRDISTDAEPELYEARVTADAFCWSMVRSLVGGAPGHGGEGAPCPRLHRRAARGAGAVAAGARGPAKGLALAGVDYPDDSELAARADKTHRASGCCRGGAPSGGQGLPGTQPVVRRDARPLD